MDDSKTKELVQWISTELDVAASAAYIAVARSMAAKNLGLTEATTCNRVSIMVQNVSDGPLPNLEECAFTFTDITKALDIEMESRFHIVHCMSDQLQGLDHPNRNRLASFGSGVLHLTQPFYGASQ